MSDNNDKDLDWTKDLFEFLQGVIPESYKIPRKNRPKLTADQAWTVVWYIQEKHADFPDAIERCDVCGDLYHSWQEGSYLDFGKAPYSFCDNCMASDQYAKKEARDPERNK